MLRCFSGKTADKAWQKAADAFRNGESTYDEFSRGGPSHELLHVCFEIEDPRQRWIASRYPAMNPAFGLVEVVWIMNGRNDSEFLNFWCPQYSKFAGNGPTYPGAYGHRLRHNFGMDQLEVAFRTLRDKPSTRQLVLQIWDPRRDLPNEGGLPASPDIPCNITAMLKVRDNRLHWTQIIRSNDMRIGVPHNFVQFTSLQEILAGWSGLELGPYVQWSDSLHFYERDMEDARAQSNERALPNEDSLALPKDESDNAFRILAERMEQMIEPETSPSQIASLVKNHGLPQGHENMLMIVAADAARRKGSDEVACEIAGRCQNPLFNQMWRNWMRLCAPSGTTRTSPAT